MDTYQTDILGDGFESRAFEMKDDYEGKTILTLIRKKVNTSSTKAILYVHGFNDYFFQTEEANFFIDLGFHFYAVDLRKYGRSLLPHQKLNNCRSLEEYFDDLLLCIQRIKNEGIDSITMVAHSTGGLICTLFLEKYKDQIIVDQLILNSPFYAMNVPWTLDKLGIPVASFIGQYLPQIKLNANLSSNYGKSIHASYDGEWNFNTDWKPISPPSVNLGWIRAIHLGHLTLLKGISINTPTLMLTSDSSTDYKQQNNKADGVLNVDKLINVAKKIDFKNGLTIKKIPNALHDIALSEQSVRTVYYETISKWLGQKNQVFR